MRIIISPAKGMREEDVLSWHTLPQFLADAEYLLGLLRGMPPAALQALWQCSDRLAALNLGRLRHMDLRRRLSPALLAYDGLQFRAMAPNVFTDGEFAYADEHLRILSGFYGLLRPFDGVAPYRLEMQARLGGAGFSSLYEFWGGRLAAALGAETGLVVDLASREYSRAVLPHLPDSVRCVACRFRTLTPDGRLVEKAAHCKMARGAMVRFMAGRELTDESALPQFSALGYHFDEKLSRPSELVFVRRAQ